MRIFNIVLFVVICLIWQIGYSQFNKPQKNDIPELKNYAIKTYNINNGLPSNSTTSAIKDRNGFLWVGTENGLCRFDGYFFKTFVNIPGDSTSLTNNYINTIIEEVWINGHLLGKRPNGFIPFQYEISSWLNLAYIQTMGSAGEVQINISSKTLNR